MKMGRPTPTVGGTILGEEGSPQQNGENGQSPGMLCGHNGTHCLSPPVSQNEPVSP